MLDYSDIGAAGFFGWQSPSQAVASIVNITRN